MKITLTNAQMLDSLSALAEANEPGKLGYAIARNRRRLQGELTEYLAVREELLKEYGTDKGGGQYGFTPESAEHFQRALEEYAKLETELELMTVPTELFVNSGLTSRQMFVLDWMEEETHDGD